MTELEKVQKKLRKLNARAKRHSKALHTVRRALGKIIREGNAIIAHTGSAPSFRGVAPEYLKALLGELERIRQEHLPEGDVSQTPAKLIRP